MHGVNREKRVKVPRCGAAVRGSTASMTSLENREDGASAMNPSQNTCHAVIHRRGGNVPRTPSTGGEMEMSGSFAPFFWHEWL